jgi:perosamine synthetase
MTDTPKLIRKIASSQPYFPAEEVDWILDEMRTVLESGVLTRGPQISTFERLFAEYIGVKEAIAVSNGTTALEIILRFYELSGAEVIVPTNTFLASANAVIFAGGLPVFCDIERNSLCAGLQEIKEQVTERTKGVILVHIAGMICPEIDAIRDFCRSADLFLIEDAAHAHGASWKGRMAGNLADAGAFSMFPTKPMTTGEGGMITTNDVSLGKFARAFRSHGVYEGSAVHDILGHNYRTDELSAVLGVSQTRTLDASLAVRQHVAEQYRSELGPVDGLELLGPPSGMRHAYYKFALVLPTKDQRNAMAGALKEKHGIATGTVYWPSCHVQPVVTARPDLYAVRSSMPVAEDVLPRVLCLPIHARLNGEVTKQVIHAVKAEWRLLS